ncbi:MAG: HD domain-containing protein [Chloroflexota bacterium]
MPTIAQAKNWYPSKDPVHGFDHVMRVYMLAEQIAQAEGADMGIVRAAVLLHDAQDPDRPRLKRGTHQLAAAAIAQLILVNEGWPAGRISAVEHCIRSHRFRDPKEPPQTLEAKVLFDADKLDAIGAIGVARAIAYAASHSQPVYATPSEQFLTTGELEPGEPHSAYHEFRFKLVKLKDRLYTETARRIGEQRHFEMVAFFETLAREAT